MRWNFKGMCVENGIGYELRFSQTDDMKLISQYHLTYTLYSGFDRLQFYVTEIR